MKKAFTFLIFSFSIFVMQAQNYQPFTTNGIAYFEHENLNGFSQLCNNCVFPAKFDTIIVGSNSSEIVHTSTFKGEWDTAGCSIFRDTSWLGYSTLSLSNGDYTFFNKNGATISLQTQASLNSSWTVYTFTNGNYFEATVTQIASETFLGIAENVKTIELQLKNSLGNNVTHILNGKKIKISENHGFIQSISFLDFPNDDSQIELVGHSQLNEGFKNITFKDIYNFDIDDELHILDAYAFSSTYRIDTYILWRILSKTELTDRYEYTIHREKARIVTNTETNYFDTTYVADTFQQTYFFEDELDEFEPYILKDIYPYSDSYRPMYADIVQTDRWGNSYGGRWWKIRHWQNLYQYSPSHQCYGHSLLGPLDSTHIFFIDGLGGPYGPSSYGHNYRDVKYYKKGSETWGTPFDYALLTNNRKVIANNHLTIFPNPTSNYLQITTTKTVQNGQIQIFNTAGKLIFSKNINAENQWRLDVSNYPTGIYILKMQTEEGVWSEKFIKQ